MVQTPSGLYVPRGTPRKYPTAVDLFCGVGGMTLGLVQGGFEVLCGCDNDPDAALNYMHNLGTYPIQVHYVEEADEDRLEQATRKLFLKQEGGLAVLEAQSGGGYLSKHPELPGVSHFWFGDLSKLSGERILDSLGLQRGELDCVVGGPPCQGFSIGNTRRSVMDPRNSLVFEFVRLVVAMLPKTMVFENVPGIMSMTTPEGVPVVDAMCRILEDGGFGAWEALRKSLELTAGAGGVVRGRPAAKGGPEQEQAEPEQHRLF